MIVINARFLTQPISGVQRFAIEISKELNKSGLPVVFVAPKNIIHHELAEELDVKYIGGFKGHLWEQITLQKYVLRKNALLISFCNTAPLFIKKQIVTIHDLCFKIHPEWFSKTFSTAYNFLIPRIAKTSLHIITVSETSKKEIVKELLISENKVSVVYNAVAPIFFKDQSLEFSNNNLLKNNYLLTVSSHHPRKNFERLIEAFVLIDDNDLYLYIIGNVNEHFANKSINEVTNNRIRFLADISDAELVNYYRFAKLFVFPSLYEGFGIPIIEALSQKTPVCVSDIPVFKEVCGDNAIYFDPKSPLSIKNGILNGLENENMVNKHRNKLALKYSWKTSADLLVGIIKKFKK
ncbi:glycosyltransferase family 4 protein [Arenibacter amylolyticus]|uniref:glycosyltransferase family 4 protein n=1 Tax=Arenibacter amylolyticus TaxID=1406873 RepID=UPI000A3D095F|nr:glycosyltransferase family 1 protein [Arenibacter amylolyticus]